MTCQSRKKVKNSHNWPVLLKKSSNFMHANQFLDLPKIPNLRVLSCWLFLRNFTPLSSTQVGQRQELSFFKIFCFSWFIKEAKPNVNCYSLYICLDPEVRRQSLTKVRLAYSKESIIGIFWSLLQNFPSVWLSFSKTFIWPIILFRIPSVYSKEFFEYFDPSFRNFLGIW